MDILELIDDREHSNLGNSARPFSCPWPNCVKSFNRKSDLQRHHRIHTNERPYSCSHAGCGKSFIQRSALTVHIRTHTGEKPHHCEYIGCGKCFSDSSSLARHRRIHTGKRPYKCVVDKCDKSFCRKTTLTKHARRTHCIRNENDLSDDDGSDSDSDPQMAEQPLQQSGWARSHHSMPRAFAQNGLPMNRTQSLQNFKTEVLPQSPQTSRSLSNRTSFSTDAFGYVSAPMMQAQNSAQSFASNNPPTPQSPIYLAEHSHDDGISQMGAAPRALGGDFQSVQRGPHHPVSQTDIDAMKIVCSSPAKHQQLVAPNLQNSPSSLSSCSSTTSNSCQSQEYYYRNTQHTQVPHYQLQTNPLDANSMMQYQQIPVSMPTGGANQIHTAPTPEQHMWYDTMAYQPPVMVTPAQPVGQPRLYPTFVNGYQMQPEWLVKTEQDPSMMLPSPRAALY